MSISARMITAISYLFVISFFVSLATSNHAGSPEPIRRPNPFRSDRVAHCELAVGAPLATHSGLFSSSGPLKVGAIVPPTEGRFVAAGADWLFVADYPEFSAVIIPAPRRRPLPTNRFRVAAGQDQAPAAGGVKSELCAFTDKTNDATRNPPANPLRNDDQGYAFAFDEHANTSYSNAFPDRMIVADNLMLGRLLEHIDRHESSERYLVSGEIIEQLGRPCLLIHTAKPSKPAYIERMSRGYGRDD